MMELDNRLKDLSTPKGRRLEDIINDMYDNDEPYIKEMVDLIDFLVTRLTYTDAERFGA